MFGYEFWYAMGTIGVCVSIGIGAWSASKLADRKIERWNRSQSC